MRHLIRLLACSVMLAALAVAAFPQEPELTPEQKRENERIAMYTEYYDKRKAKDNDGAYEVAKKFVADFADKPDEYFNAVKKFIGDHEEGKKVDRRKAFYELLKAKRYDDAFAASGQILAEAPPTSLLQINYDLTKAGWDAAEQQKNTKNNAAAIAAGKKTLELLAAGKTIRTSADKVKGDTSYALGTMTEKPDEKIPYFIEAARTQAYGKDAGLYFDLALAYQDSEFAKNQTAYRAVQNKTADDPDVKAALKAYQESADRLMDALARAISFATPADASIKKDSTTLITDLYKFRNKSETGLQAFIATVPARKLPQPGEPIDYFPPPAPKPAPGTTGNGGADGTMTPPTAGTPAAGTAPATKPAAKPKPKAKKPAKRGGK